MSKNLLQLESVQVEGLFGLSNIFIRLDDLRPTVLTGSNGTGKSTILRLVNDISRGDLLALSNAPLEYLKLTFEDGSSFEMSRLELNMGFSLTWGEKTGLLAISEVWATLPDWAADALRDNGRDVDATLDGLSEHASSLGIPFREYDEARSILRNMSTEEAPVHGPPWLDEFVETFAVLFVTDQRLVSESRRSRRLSTTQKISKSSTLAVETAGFELADQIRRADSNYARASQMQDRRFPQQLLEAMAAGQPVHEESLSDLVQEVDSRRESLRRVGLLDSDDRFGPELSATHLQDASQQRVMEAVLRATVSKLEVFKSLEGRLNALKNFLDERFSPKQVELSRGEGLRFRLPNGSKIRPRQLSSGEQQMMVLAYEIVFKATPGTLVIIDEPEISLHVLWQDTLIRDLKNLGEPSQLKYLLATHSPMILAGYPELERPLNELAD